MPNQPREITLWYVLLRPFGLSALHVYVAADSAEEAEALALAQYPEDDAGFRYHAEIVSCAGVVLIGVAHA